MKFPALVDNKDIFLIGTFVLILLMIILPLPTLLMDILIALNMSASIMVILIALHMKQPVQFSTFPSLLLITTLFRLAISISTTRLILVDGDAGEIVETFGRVVVGGNLVVGLVIFLIITVVQFLVITKGADRVAEVGARFTLDGMPGKQMSIDSDVRAGSLDHIDARLARGNVEREAKLFGSMDGAMKFVKGDAIASLVITAINLLGGIMIGMAQRGMEFAQALELYALLTIGDGLIAQIPALLISVASGIIVTRVTHPDGLDLGTEIANQVTANDRTLMISGLIVAVFGFIPGFPTFIFMSVGLLMSGSILYVARKTKKQAIESFDNWDATIANEKARISEYMRRSRRNPSVTIILPESIRNISPDLFTKGVDRARNTLHTRFGLPIGVWAFELNPSLGSSYQIYIGKDLVKQDEINLDTIFVRMHASYIEALGIEIKGTFGSEEGVLVSSDYDEMLTNMGIPTYDALLSILLDLQKCVNENLDKFITIQSTKDLLQELKFNYPDLIGNIDDKLSTAEVSRILQMLLKERVPITSLPRILEATLRYTQKSNDVNFILQMVRAEIGDFLTSRYAPNGFMPVVILSPSLEGVLREGVRSSEEGTFLIVEHSISKHIADKVREYVGDEQIGNLPPVFMSQQDVRLALFNVLYENNIFANVLAYQEITPDTTMYPLDFIDAI